MENENTSSESKPPNTPYNYRKEWHNAQRSVKEAQSNTSQLFCKHSGTGILMAGLRGCDALREEDIA